MNILTMLILTAVSSCSTMTSADHILDVSVLSERNRCVGMDSCLTIQLDSWGKDFRADLFCTHDPGPAEAAYVNLVIMAGTDTLLNSGPVKGEIRVFQKESYWNINDLMLGASSRSPDGTSWEYFYESSPPYRSGKIPIPDSDTGRLQRIAGINHPDRMYHIYRTDLIRGEISRSNLYLWDDDTGKFNGNQWSAEPEIAWAEISRLLDRFFEPTVFAGRIVDPTRDIPAPMNNGIRPFAKSHKLMAALEISNAIGAVEQFNDSVTARVDQFRREHPDIQDPDAGTWLILNKLLDEAFEHDPTKYALANIQLPDSNDTNQQKAGYRHDDLSQARSIARRANLTEQFNDSLLARAKRYEESIERYDFRLVFSGDTFDKQFDKSMIKDIKAKINEALEVFPDFKLVDHIEINQEEPWWYYDPNSQDTIHSALFQIVFVVRPSSRDKNTDGLYNHTKGLITKAFGPDFTYQWYSTKNDVTPLIKFKN